MWEVEPTKSVTALATRVGHTQGETCNLYIWISLSIKTLRSSTV